MAITTLSASALRLRVDPDALGFADTSELLGEPLPWIGQERAEQAARFGLNIDQPDYHLFVLGETGSGRTTLMHEMVQRVASTRPVPPDLVYLHDFEVPERPRALRLPAGQGRQLRQLMGELAKTLQTQIPRRLLAPDFKVGADRVESTSQAEEDRAFAELSAFAEARHFGLLRDQGHMVFTRRDEAGEPLTAAKAMTLSPAERAAIDADEEALRAEIGRFMERSRARELATHEALTTLRRQAIKPLLEHELQAIRGALRKQIKDSVKLGRYLDQVQQHVLDNLELFEAGEAPDEEVRVASLLELLTRLRVNVAVDHHDSTGAPVIADDNPVFRSLFGSIEYETENDVLVTDFSRIRAGSLLKAHGGFLLLHLQDLLADPAVWEKLRRFLRTGRLQIEEPGMIFAPISAVALQPEPVDVAVKIVLIASVEDYYLVQEGDPDVARRFRCKVDFAERFAATDASRRATAIFVAHACRRMGLPHFTAAAVAVLIEASHREAEDQTRQSAIFARTEALVTESAAAARVRGASHVDAADVRAAIQAAIHRHDHPEQRLQDSIADGERLIDVAGECIGQVNGLSVVDLGDHRFGFPVRVTASTHAGEEGLLNIEREVELSGPIHDKGVLILQSHLSALFGHIAPLALNAAVVFEQEYSGVEGDSASCAEFYALLSGLAGLPLRQGIAVTGAINQTGAMLPVGGVNEKIEGWFRTCERLGLDGRQGVLIPQRNRRHLMLSPAVVDAVAQGRFHIHTAERAGEGMELLTGRPYGSLGAGGYPADSVLGQAQRTLQAYRRACQAVGEPHASYSRARRATLLRHPRRSR
jgi:predicted ATP-dependent protease